MRQKKRAQHWTVGNYTISHCGHPTALWPYYLTDTQGRMILAPNGQGFQTLASASAAAELLDAGELCAAPRVCLAGRTRKQGLMFDLTRFVVMLRGYENVMENRPIVDVIAKLQAASSRKHFRDHIPAAELDPLS